MEIARKRGLEQKRKEHRGLIVGSIRPPPPSGDPQIHTLNGLRQYTLIMITHRPQSCIHSVFSSFLYSCQEMQRSILFILHVINPISCVTLVCVRGFSINGQQRQIGRILLSSTMKISHQLVNNITWQSWKWWQTASCLVTSMIGFSFFVFFLLLLLLQFLCLRSALWVANSAKTTYLDTLTNC